MSIEESVDVAIVGGGVAGGAAACAFTARGFSVAVFERRDLARDPNRGDALEHETALALEKLGAKAELERRGAHWVKSIVFTDGGEKAMVRAELGENSRFVLNHAEIEAGLLAVAEGRRARIIAKPVTSVERSGAAWRVIAEGDTVSARLLVAADGAKSMIRDRQGIEMSGHEYEHSIVILHAPRPEWLSEDVAWFIIHAHGGIFVLPTTPRDRCRLVVTVPRPEATSWMKEEDDELRARLARRCERLGDLKLERLGGSHVYHVARRHAARYVGEGLALIGDAAHVTHPMGGWGMNLAIRDAATLSDVVGPALASGSSAALQEKLAEYDRVHRRENEKTMSIAHRHSKFLAPNAFTYAIARSALAVFSQVKGTRSLPLLR
jgi:ubiquinone biosynthesis UbiH/UbiF/VisC/COQ6 family hydroxylase